LPFTDLYFPSNDLAANLPQMTAPTQILIPPPLKPWLKAAWVYDQENIASRNGSLTFFADGCPGILFYGAPGGLSVSGSSLSSFLVYGQTIKPVTLQATQHAPVIAVSFHSHVLPMLFRVDAFEITDKCLELQLLPAVPRISLNELWRNNQCLQQQIATIFAYLHALIAGKTVKEDAGLAYAASTILKSKGNVSLKKIQQELNCTERTLERRFKQFIGVSPTLFTTVSRFHASFQQMLSSGFQRLSDIAYENGYADQSHFIRQFKTFTGHTPLAFYRQHSETAGSSTLLQVN
jgi:AraC-like DNA-binding protein